MKADETLQFIIVGDSNVGKTSLLQKYFNKFFTNQSLPTLGCDYFTRFQEINNKIYKIKIWDTAGQERYSSLTRSFFRNADGVIVVYDTTCVSSFDRVKNWMGSIYEYKTSGDVYVILVGNKCDLLERREVSLEEGRELANKYQVAYFETSAKEDIGVNECFEKLIHDSVMFAHPIKENEIVDNKGIGCCY